MAREPIASTDAQVRPMTQYDSERLRFEQRAEELKRKLVQGDLDVDQAYERRWPTGWKENFSIRWAGPTTRRIATRLGSKRPYFWSGIVTNILWHSVHAPGRAWEWCVRRFFRRAWERRNARALAQFEAEGNRQLQVFRAKRQREFEQVREEQVRSFAYGNAALSDPDVTREMVDDAAKRGT